MASSLLNIFSSESKEELNDVLFFHPNEDDSKDFECFCNHLNSSKKSLDICVFTLNDNRIRNILTDKHLTGIKVRIISDNLQSKSFGSDIIWLNEQGIDVKLDNDPSNKYHMHHKFVVIDNVKIISGSYNWTQAANLKNFENVIITNNNVIVKKYHDYFNKLWNDKSFLISIHSKNKNNNNNSNNNNNNNNNNQSIIGKKRKNDNETLDNNNSTLAQPKQKKRKLNEDSDNDDNDDIDMDHNNNNNNKKKTELTKKRFLEISKKEPISMFGKNYELQPKEFTTGSVGWSLSTNIGLDIDDNNVRAMITTNVVIKQSKEWK